jgi:MFS family permease
VSFWFDRARGLALGIAMAGSGLAGVLAPVLTNRAIEAFGWRGADVALGLFIGVIAVPMLWVFFHERRDDVPGHRDDSSATEAPSLTGLTLHEAVRTLAFWKIGLGFFFVASVVSGVIINLVPLLIDRGLRPAAAASVASVLGLAVMFGRLGTGYLLDRFSAPLVAVVLIALAAGGCVLLTLPDLPAWMLSLAAIFVGLCSAAEADLVSYLTGRFLGVRAYGRIFGWQLSMYFGGAATGPLAAGFAYDHFHSYVPTLEISAVSLLVGATVLGSLGRAPRFAEP